MLPSFRARLKEDSMLSTYFKSQRGLARYQQSPWHSELDGFTTWLEHLGFGRKSVRQCVHAAFQFAAWAADSGLPLEQLNREALSAFAVHLGSEYSHLGTCRARAAAAHFLDFLDDTHRLSQPLDPLKPTPPALIVAFRHWMRVQRGTLDITLSNYQPTLEDLLRSLGEDTRGYDARTLRAFVLERSGRQSPAAAKTTVTAVRMFLRFLTATGQCASGLDQAIPTVARWRLASLPRYISPEEVERVIASCDLSEPMGVRDHAVLLLLSRLGLRAGDVAGLLLNDIDWPSGTLCVAGKNRRGCRLPLPQDAGNAVLAYLEQRPRIRDAHLFLTAVAPIRGMTYLTVSQIVTRALQRVGIELPRYGAHVLRHSAATGLLREGMSLATIGVVLRHASIETTAIYAKVDVPRLRAIASPWPEVATC
jgi:integrase/recombinase XerD